MKRILSLKEIERLGIPEYEWWNEALHGVARAGLATVYPQSIGLAATFDPEGLQGDDPSRQLVAGQGSQSTESENQYKQ